MASARKLSLAIGRSWIATLIVMAGLLTQSIHWLIEDPHDIWALWFLCLSMLLTISWLASKFIEWGRDG